MATTDDVLAELQAFREETQGQLARVIDGVAANASSIADTRRAIRALDDKLVSVQEALYLVAVKKLAESEAEEVRSMLPDPPRRVSSLG